MDAIENDSAIQNGSEIRTDSANQHDTVTDKTSERDASAAEVGAAEAAEEPSDVSAEVPQQRNPEPAAPDVTASDTGSSKGKKRKSAPKSKATGTKALVVFRDGKLHYADESVIVLDLDDAAHPDTDVHDVVDKLSELRDAAESPGKTEAVTLIAELIQAKALA